MTSLLSASLRYLAILGVFSLMASFVSAAPKSSVSFEQALADARQVTKMNPAWSVMRCAGISMDPFFGDASLMLVEAVDFAKVREGMVIVYRDAEDDLVAHSVISVSPDGIIAKGYNNRTEDPHPVTADSFVGVAFGFLHTNGDHSGASELPVAIGKTF